MDKQLNESLGIWMNEGRKTKNKNILEEKSNGKDQSNEQQAEYTMGDKSS